MHLRLATILLFLTVGPLARSSAQVATPPPERSTTELILESRGSLMRATLAGEADRLANDPAAARPRATLSTASFFMVPEPLPRTVSKHDLVTIIVREQSEFSSQGTTELTKNAALQAQITQFIRLNLANLALENGVTGVAPRLDLSGSRSFSGEGSTDRNDRFTARITAEVLDVKPNGNIVLAARKRIVTDGEEQIFLISGIARTADITADNTILSTQMFDLDLRRMSRGAVRDATRRGAIPELLDQINPW